MPKRTLTDKLEIEDLLREEYFDLLPEIRKVVQQLEAEIRFYTLPILRELRSHEQLVIKSRVKECESALKTLRDKSEGRVFDPDRFGGYSMLDLPDLAGVRVLVFPNRRLTEVDTRLLEHFSPPNWIAKPVKDDFGYPIAQKYIGYCDRASSRIKAEYQVVPMLLGLFWEVEHSAMYKSGIVASSENMRRRRAEVENALSRFEEGMARIIPDA